MKKYDSFSIKINEDKDTREERRRERKEKRAEKGFEKGEFKIKPYIKALDLLKNSIISTISDVERNISQGYDSLDLYKNEFNKYLVRVSSIIGEIRYIQSKEGRKLEDDDKDLIEGFTEIYLELEKDVDNSIVEYTKKRDSEITKKLKESRFENIINPIKEAKSIFDSALKEIKKVTEELRKKAINSIPGKENVNNENSIKLKSPLKKGTKNSNELKEIQKLILDKFKNHDVLSKLETFINFKNQEKNFGNFGNSTEKMIKILKDGYDLKDKENSDITQELVDKIINENNSSINESILSFSEFSKKYNVSEDLNISKVVKADKEIQGKNKISDKNTQQEEVNKNEQKKEIKKALVSAKPEPKELTDKDLEEIEKRILEKGIKLGERKMTLEKLQSLNLKGFKLAKDYEKSKDYPLDTKNPNKGWFAESNGLYFFDNNVGVRKFDGEICFYNVNSSSGKGTCVGKDYSYDNLVNLSISVVPNQYKIYTNAIYNSLVLNLTKENKEYWEKLANKVSDRKIRIILNSFKSLNSYRNNKRDLFDLLRDKRENPIIKPFYDKWKKIIAELI